MDLLLFSTMVGFKFLNMSLKIENILFTGPFIFENYYYRKNKPPTLILLVAKEGKNYNPEFFAQEIILADENDISFKDRLNNKNFESSSNIHIFFREYKNKSLMISDYKHIKNLIDEAKKLRMKY